MEKITAYRDSNGHLYDDYGQAANAQADIIGQALDNLMIDIGHSRITKADRHRLIANTMKSKDFKSNVYKLFNAVENEDWGNLQDYLIKTNWFEI